MNWRQKAFIQRACAALPRGNEALYYFLQSNFGSLRQAPDPMPNLRAAAGLASDLAAHNALPEGRRVMEVGTGRRLDMPLAFYLLGATSVDTVDLHSYLKEPIVLSALRSIVANRDELASLFSPFTDAAALSRRLDSLAPISSLPDLLAKTRITYHAPVDATRTHFPPASFDLQFSYTVFEHIPYDVLRGILSECRRVLSPTGIACHHIDLSDHFAHDDPSISFVNFLRYGEKEWNTYNDNQFAYHNRLREPDYQRLYREAGHELLAWRTWRDERGERELSSGNIPLAEPFRGQAVETLATVVVRAISAPRAAFAEAKLTFAAHG
jgi:SAM-dependent methyltransferase